MWPQTSLGSLVTYNSLKRTPSSSPGSIRASMVSISWEGLLLTSSPPKMSLRHWSAGLGVNRSSNLTLRVT